MPAASSTELRPVAGREDGRPRSGRGNGASARPALVRLEKPVISFTFDIFTRSAARNAALVLEAAGARGTFYASAGLAGQTTQYGDSFDGADLERLTGAGHEIGCQTYAHLDCDETRTDAVFADMVRNAEALGKMGLGDRLTSFAYPHGAVSTALSRALPSRFTTARGRTPGVAFGKVDLARLPSNRLYGDDTHKSAIGLMEMARRRKAWLIFHAHDVSPRPSRWGTPTAQFERIVAAAFTRGIEVAPMRVVAARLGATPV